MFPLNILKDLNSHYREKYKTELRNDYSKISANVGDLAGSGT